MSESAMGQLLTHAVQQSTMTDDLWFDALPAVDI
jgi:hypothetical protein